MPYRPCPDLPPPSDADVDTAETVEAASAIERGERHLRMLAELAEIAMTLARSLGELALARIDEVKSTDAKLAPGEDSTELPEHQQPRKCVVLATLADPKSDSHNRGESQTEFVAGRLDKQTRRLDPRFREGERFGR